MTDDANSAKDDVKYASFWQRATRETLLWTFGLLIVGGLVNGVKLGWKVFGLTFGLGSACALIYGSLRESFSHIEVVGASGREIGFFRGTLRQLVVILPFVVYRVAAVFGERDFEQSHKDYADIVKGCVVVMGSSLFCQHSLKLVEVDLKYWPLLFLAIVLMNAPMFFTRERRSVADLIMRTRVIQVDKGDGRLARVWRAALFIPCLAFILLFAAASAWVAWNGHDAELDPRAAAFFSDRLYQPQDNYYTAWNGLKAPADIKDIYAYGRGLSDGSIKPDVGHALSFQGDTSRFCYQQSDFTKMPDCADAAALQKMAGDNAVLLDRYRTLYKYKNHDAGIDGGNLMNINAGETVGLHDLMAALWASQARAGRAEDALPQWIDDMAFNEAVLPSRHTTFGQSLWMRAYTLDLEVLPLLINTPALAAKYHDQIVPLLAKEFPDPAIYNVLQQAQQDYYSLRDMRLGQLPGDTVFMKPNDTRNALFELAQQLDAVSKTPPAELPQKIRELEASYSSRAFYNTFGRRFVEGEAHVADLFTSATRDKAWTRALTLYINAKAANVPAVGVEAFLRQAAPAQFDPYTQKPFRWDAKTASIYWNTEKGERREIYY